MTDDTLPPFVHRKKLTVDFAGGNQSRDAGLLLLHEGERKLGICRRLADLPPRLLPGPEPYRSPHVSGLRRCNPVHRSLLKWRGVYPKQRAVALLLLERPFGRVVFEISIGDLAEQLASDPGRANAKRACGNAAAQRNCEILARATGLRRRDSRGRTETLAADHGAVAVLIDSKTATVFHDQIEVVTIADLGVCAAADGVGNLVGAKHATGYTLGVPMCPTQARSEQYVKRSKSL
jgi:hypothetical protein